MIVRATIANIGTRDLAELGQAAGLNGTVFESTGFGSWGIEPGATVEFAVNDERAAHEVRAFVVAVLKTRGESAAYMTYDGRRAELLYASWRREALAA